MPKGQLILISWQKDLLTFDWDLKIWGVQQLFFIEFHAHQCLNSNTEVLYSDKVST